MTEHILTDAEKKDYLITPNKCPRYKCKGNKLQAHRIEQDSKGAWQWITCESCGFVWRDNYKLESITTKQELAEDTKNTKVIK